MVKLLFQLLCLIYQLSVTLRPVWLWDLEPPLIMRKFNVVYFPLKLMKIPPHLQALVQ